MDNEPEAQDVVLATITITYSLTADGGDLVETSAVDEQGDIPPLITMLGMMDLARGSLYDMTMNPEQDAEEEAEGTE